MDETIALNSLQEYLKVNSNFKENQNYKFIKKSASDGTEFYYCFEINDEEIPARGGNSYYIFPNGSVLMPYGGSSKPETAESVYNRWKESK